MDATVAQAMNTLVFCLECLRPENEQKLSKNRAEGNHKFHQFSIFAFSQRVWHVRADHIMIESQFPFLSGVDGVFFTTYSY